MHLVESHIISVDFRLLVLLAALSHLLAEDGGI